MASATAKLGHLPISPRKVRLVVDLIRGKNVAQARDILQFTVKDAALPLRKLLDSACANAEQAATERDERIDPDEMFVNLIYVNEGRTLKRFQPGPRGRAMRIRKRSSQVHLTISEKE